MTSRELFFQDGNSKSWGLVVDTSSFNGLLATVNPQKQILSLKTWDKSARHSHSLVPNFQEITSKLDLNHLKHIFFIQGPGSFTGLRVGAAFAKSLSFALGGVPISCSSSFLPAAISLIKTQPNISSFHILSPSIGSKVFAAKFNLDSPQKWTENIYMDGAKTEYSKLENSFSYFSQVTTSSDTGLLDYCPEDTISSTFPSKFIRSYDQNATHLDLYPLYLRKSEAEEKLDDKAKLQSV